jgi:short-subunit dehydrogenase
MQTHFAAPVYTTLAVLPHMKRRRDGRIVNIASIGGKIAAPHLLPYSASKFALVGFSQGLRAELMKDNIYVTTVCPGLIRTGSPLNALFKGRHEEEFAWFATSDVTPVISIGANRLAARIIRAAQHGQAELITPLVANAQAKLSSLFPGLISELSALVHERVLPSSGGIGARWARGFESTSAQVPEFARRANIEAAIEHNELPPHT